MDESFCVWAKASYDTITQSDTWLPLWMHLRDTAGVSQILWDIWIPSAIKNILTIDLELTTEDAGKLLVILSSLHDIGKSTPDFSGRKSLIFDTEKLYSFLVDSGFSFNSLNYRTPVRHEIFSAAFLEKIAQNEGHNFSRQSKQTRETFAVILAGHHGLPKMKSEVFGTNVLGYIKDLETKWSDSVDNVTGYITTLYSSEMAVLNNLWGLDKPVSQRAQILLTSLVIMSDWIASNPDFFPLLPIDSKPHTGEKYGNRLEIATQKIIEVIPPFFDSSVIALDIKPETRFSERFSVENAKLYPSQIALIEAVSEEQNPENIYILEAPMGEGKTEAALLAGEILMKRTGKNGLYIALPTMATGEAMYSRVIPYVENLLNSTKQQSTLSLSHSKSFLSSNYSIVKQEAWKNKKDYGFVPEGWLATPRIKPLNSFIVGTIDSFLMMSLKVKYNYWRHLGFASKVIIVDEVHSADEYMTEYLKRSLEWAGYYGCPVILLSATLETSHRAALVEAYLKGKEAKNV